MPQRTVPLVKKYLKTGIAGLLFSGLCIGGCAAVMTMIATGISTVTADSSTGAWEPTGGAYASNSSTLTAAAGVVASSQPVAGVSAPTTEEQPSAVPVQSGQTMQNTNPTPLESSGSDGTRTTVPYSGTGRIDVTDMLNNRIDHMNSPIGDAMNDGGVALGQQVQDSVGRVLASVLETLFLERPATPSSYTGH